MSTEVICDGCNRNIFENDFYFSVIASTSKMIIDYEMGERNLPSVVERQFCNECVSGSHHNEGVISWGHIEFSRFIELRFSEGYEQIAIMKKYAGRRR